MDVFLCLIYFVIFLFTLNILYKNNRFFGIFYLFLFIYNFPGLLGYRFFSILSIEKYVYFGESLWYEFYFLIILSMLTFFIVSMILVKKNRLKPFFTIKKGNLKAFKNIGYILLVLLYLFQIFLFILNFQSISWSNLANDNFMSNNFLIALGNILFKISNSIIIVLIALIFENNSKNKKSSWLKLFVVFYLLYFILYSYQAGNRSSVLGLVAGLVFFLLSYKRLKFKEIFKYLFFVFVFFIFMYYIQITRDAYISSSDTFIENILRQDYYWPTQMLPVVINFNYINPVELLTANILKSIIFVDYQYIHVTVGNLFASGIVTGAQGYGFYIFTEGYIFSGISGFLYNGILIPLLLIFWFKIGYSYDKFYSLAISSIMISDFINIIRGGSLYFIRNFYTIIIPVIILYLMLSEKKLILIRKYKDY